MKPNCYDCIYRGEIPGDAHSRCNHPSVKQDDNVFAALAGVLVGTNREAQQSLRIRAHPHGIRMGWFMWPANFDPTWLENCDGFTPRSATPERPSKDKTL